MTRRLTPYKDQSKGIALVVVLGALLLIGAVAFATVFMATLDSLAARSRQIAVVEREELEGALALAALETWTAYLASSGLPGSLWAEYGPWPSVEIAATVSAEEVSFQAGQVVVLLTARYLADSSSSHRQRMLLQLEPELKLLRRW